MIQVLDLSEAFGSHMGPHMGVQAQMAPYGLHAAHMRQNGPGAILGAFINVVCLESTKSDTTSTFVFPGYWIHIFPELMHIFAEIMHIFTEIMHIFENHENQ